MPRFTLGVLFAVVAAATGAEVPVHGLWVWKSATVLEAPRGAETLRDFCTAEGINEVYVSASGIGEASTERRIAGLVALLHRSHIRVEALLSSVDADEPGKPREKLLDHVQEVISFNQSHPADRFEGIHLDIEPQQRPENKGSGNLRFLAGLVDAYRAVRVQAERAQLTVDADIQNKLLKGNAAERRLLLSSLPRLTLMLYELSSPGDGYSVDKKMATLRTKSQEFLAMAYEGLGDATVGRLVIALRTPDYAELLPAMLKGLDQANRSNPHYLGWARHAYNDTLKAAR